MMILAAGVDLALEVESWSSASALSASLQNNKLLVEHRRRKAVEISLSVHTPS